MANTIDWGQGAVNNTNNWGKGKTNATNNWGAIYDSTAVGETNIIGGSSFTNTYSMSLDGVDEYVYLGNDASRKVQTLTMSVWVKPTASASDPILLNGHPSYGNQGIEIFWNFNLFRVRINGTSYGLGAGSGQNNWTHIVISYDGNTLKRMTNGVQFADVVVGATINYTNYSGLLIGLSPSGYYKGLIDEVAFWDSDQSANFSTIYNSGVPSDLTSLSPLSWYRMGDGDTWNGSSWTLTDNGSGGNDATSVNMEEADRVPITPNSYTQNSFSFDGVDESFDLPNITIDNTSFTFSMWIKPINTIGLDMLIQKKSTPRNVMFGLQGLTGSFCALVTYSDNSSSVKVQSNYIAKVDMLNNWSHVVIVRNGLDSTFYLNGSNIGGGTFASSQPSTIDIDTIGFGFSNWYFQGNIDEVAIWNSQLSASDISTIFNNGVPTDISSLNPLSHWRMGENATWNGSTWTLTDQGSGGNNATSVNMEEADKTGDQAYVL